MSRPGPNRGAGGLSPYGCGLRLSGQPLGDGRDNAEALLGIDHVTGLFVGRAAWQLPDYLRLLAFAAGHSKVVAAAKS